jgi:hypothetical protein
MTKMITSTHAPLVTAAQYDAVCQLLLTAHAAAVRLKAENAELRHTLRALQATPQTAAAALMQYFGAPEPPRTLDAVVHEQQRRGLRP